MGIDPNLVPVAFIPDHGDYAGIRADGTPLPSHRLGLDSGSEQGRCRFAVMTAPDGERFAVNQSAFSTISAQHPEEAGRPLDAQFQVLQAPSGQDQSRDAGRYEMDDVPRIWWQMALVLMLVLGAILVWNLTLRTKQLRREVERRTAGESRLRTLSEHAPLPYHSLDERGRIIAVNRAFEKTLGYDRSEVLGRRLSDWMPEPEVARFLSAFEQSLQTGQLRTNTRLLCKDGTVIQADLIGIVDTGADGDVLQSHCLWADVRRPRRAAKDICVQRNMARCVFDHVDYAVFVVEVTEAEELRFGATNAILQQWMCLSADEIAGKTPEELLAHISPLAAEAAKVNYGACVERGETLHYESPLQIGGREVWWATRLTPVKGPEGRVERIFGTIIDITKRGIAERMLEEHRDRLEELIRNRTDALELETASHRRTAQELAVFKRLVESSSQGVVFARLDGRIVYENPALRAMYGGSAGEGCADASLFRCYSPEGAEKVMATIRHTVLAAGRWTGEMELQKRSGERVRTLEHYFLIRDIQGEPLYIADIITDISDLKRVEDALVGEKERAEAANRSKSVFLGSMSHELRTPLNAILGYAGILLKESTLNGKQREGLAVIEKSGGHLLNLINDVLDISKIEANRFELAPAALELRGFVAELASIVGSQAEARGIHTDVALESGLPMSIIADAKRLRQILLNLLSNAIKFTAKGRIMLRVSRSEPLDRPDACRLRFAVEDTGSGIPAHDLKRIFKPFEQVSGPGQGQGTGLGLAIADKLVRAMGGNIEVDSRHGRGSRFWFDLDFPVVEDVIIEPPETSGVIQGYEGRRRRLTIVDDNELNRALLQDLLEPLGFLLDVASTGDACLQVVRNAPPDLILMDIFMPGMDGYEVLDALRADPLLAGVPVIAITAGVTQRDRDKAAAKGMDGFIEKPLDPDALLESIGRLLELTWRYEQEAEVPSQAEAVPFAVPSKDELMEWQALLELGRFQQALSWLEAFRQRRPEYAGFCDKAHELIQDLNETELRRLVEEHAV